MKAILIGSGGREHALAWQLSQQMEVFAAPGNPGIAQVATCMPIQPENSVGLIDLCNQVGPDLVVIGPEAPLIAGLASVLRQEGFPVFGPDAGAAQLEGSKAFSKDLMSEAKVPTARFGVFSRVDQGAEFARMLFDSGSGAVVKASGAALGKGVVVCDDASEAEESLRAMIDGKQFGVAGETVVVEERLAGREFSLLTICSDQGFFSLPVAQDHKRAYDGDLGPNTGGMGTYSPVGWVSDDLVRQTEARVVSPLLDALKARGQTYRGVLFSGLMVVDGEPFCLEYNVRFGDPETQSVMPRLGAGFGEALRAAALGLPIPPVEVKKNHTVTVVVASEGYPGQTTGGKIIEIGPLPENAMLFHAGTKQRDEFLVTAGGRVFGATGVGDSLEEAREAAYAAAAAVRFDGAWFRRDIGV